MSVGRDGRGGMWVGGYTGTGWRGAPTPGRGGEFLPRASTRANSEICIKSKRFQYFEGRIRGEAKIIPQLQSSSIGTHKRHIEPHRIRCITVIIESL